jgi:hemerythrin
MSLITWTKEQFGTNVGLHDEEHRQIFTSLNALHETTAKGDRKAVGAKFDELVDVVAKHFASEENSMTTHGLPTKDAHKVEHDKLVKTCLDLQAKFRAGQAEITPETTGFVRDWLTQHIPTIDRTYGALFNSKGMAS